MKYRIKGEFFPFFLFTPPVKSVKQAAAMGKWLKEPGWVRRTKDVRVARMTLEGYRGDPIEALVLEPAGVGKGAPCLVYYHGGGFIFPAAGYHYRLAMDYARGAGCKVVFVQYRLLPEVAQPALSEDCYGAFCQTADRADALGIDRNRIAVGGDSAGGCLAAAVCLMARDRGRQMPQFQLLIYPVVGCGQETVSNQRFTDTPMWNSTLSKIVIPAYLPREDAPDRVYAAPVEAKSFAGLPPAYIETAEFDCLHDDGIIYAEKLRAAGVSVTLNETEGTMHGFDIAGSAPTTKKAVRSRIAYMKDQFECQ